MNKKQTTPYKKAGEKVNEAHIKATKEESKYIEEYFHDRLMKEKEYVKYWEQEDKWELYKAVTAALVCKWPTRTEEDALELARSAVNITNISYSEWNR